MLAARAGMPEPQEDDKTGRLRSRILSMNKEAARYFHACLNSTVEEARQARAYCLEVRSMNLMDTLYLVIPCYNEEEVLPETSKQLLAKMQSLMAAEKISEKSRIVFVNDGSKDRTWEIIGGECI